MNKNFKLRAMTLATAISGLSGIGGVAPLALAQETGADKMLEEIVVSARRREEGLQEAPIAISAFTGDTRAVYAS